MLQLQEISAESVQWVEETLCICRDLGLMQDQGKLLPALAASCWDEALRKPSNSSALFLVYKAVKFVDLAPIVSTFRFLHISRSRHELPRAPPKSHLVTSKDDTCNEEISMQRRRKTLPCAGLALLERPGIPFPQSAELWQGLAGPGGGLHSSPGLTRQPFQHLLCIL